MCCVVCVLFHFFWAPIPASRTCFLFGCMIIIVQYLQTPPQPMDQKTNTIDCWIFIPLAWTASLEPPLRWPKVDMPNSVTSFKREPHIRVVCCQCGYENGDQKDMCWKESGICAKIMIAILGSTINIILFWGVGGTLYDHLMSTKIFIWITNKIFISISSKSYGESGFWPPFRFANHHVLITCFIS